MKRKKMNPASVLKQSAAALIGMALFYPIFWIVMTSFKTAQQVQAESPFALPHGLDLSNYVDAWQRSNLPVYYLNSLIVVFSTIAMLLALSACAAFAIEKLRFRLSKACMSYFLFGITIPIHVTLIPLFQIYRAAGILNTHIALILPQVGFNLALSIYLFSAFYRFIPGDLMEAAVIEGAGIWKTFFKVYLPLSKNTVMTVVTMNMIFTWNEFIFANTFISKAELKTIPVGLYDYVGERGMVNWGLTFAAISLFMAPLLMFYFALNKGIIAGMTAGAIKE